MNSAITILIGTLITLPTLYYFSQMGKSLNNYKRYIERFGHKLEQNEVITKDGYILSLWHLIPKFEVNTNKVIYLHPGFASTGVVYFHLENKSLAYLLQERGYDVWIGNNRGSAPCLKHVSKDSNKLNGDFWDFSMDNFIKYDIVSEINYIKNRTSAKKLDFIGYSEGTALFLMLYMDNPNFVESSINKFVSIGTIPNLSNVTIYVSELIDKAYDILKISEMFTKVFKINDAERAALKTALKANPNYFINSLKNNGFITNRTSYKGVSNFYAHYPTSTSIYNLYHWEKIQEKGKFVYYNPLSKKDNELKEYDLDVLKKWKIKSFITRSLTDNFSSYSEITKFYNNIENKTFIKIFDSSGFAHLDYALAESAYDDLYIPLVNFLDEN